MATEEIKETQTYQDVLNIRFGLNGEKPSPENPMGFKGVLQMNIPVGKFGYNKD